MAEFEWPDDPEFRRVAARIADAVTVVRAAGVPIWPFQDGITHGKAVSPLPCCPLGCVVKADNYPTAGRAAAALGIWEEKAAAFMAGFDLGTQPGGNHPEYIALGNAYRERFVR